MKIKLTYKGMDSWSRTVYEDENGIALKEYRVLLENDKNYIAN